MTEHAGMETPGGLIRSARESQGLSLAELSEKTKIPPPVIDAIERDEYHKVSGALYIKSFLRTCAVELGLDTERVLDLYGSFSGESSAQPGGADTVWEENKVEISHIGLPWRNIGLTGIGLVVVGLAVLLYMRGCGGEAEMAAAPSPGTQEVASATEAATQPDAIQDAQSPELLTEMPSGSPADSLAAGWLASPEKDLPASNLVEEQPAAEVATNSSGATPVEAPQEAAVQAVDRATLPMPLVGGPGLVFAGGGKKALVLRVISDRPVGMQVKRDAQKEFESAAWPAVGSELPPLPPTGIQAGRAYGVRRGLVVYWGADDHFSLRLDRTDGVEASLNGKPLDVRNLRPGGEMLLDNHGD